MSATTPSQQYLERIGQRIAAIRADVPRFTHLGETMAASLVAGGRLFTPDVTTWWPSEFMNRAGGMMGLPPFTYVPQSENDLAFTALPDPRFWKPAEDQKFQALLKSSAEIVIIGAESETGGSAADRFAGFTGGIDAGEGLGPHAPLRPFDQLVRGWLTAGEMIAACTRAGRMPIMWMSVWLEGALVRNASFVRHDNLREPWHVPVFHESIYVPPLAPGRVAGEFLDELEKIHAVLRAQSQQLAVAARWMRDAMAARRRPSVVAVGHSYPMLLELLDEPGYPMAWSPSISDVGLAHPQMLCEGDVALHLGYSPVNVDDVRNLLDRNIRFIYSSPYGRGSLADHPNLIWLDLPWRPGDATVDVPGYSVRLLPMSSSAHTMAYFALMAELSV